MMIHIINIGRFPTR